MNPEIPPLSDNVDDELRSEYDFDYRQARPNRFATQPAADGSLVVVLDPDVARVFTNQASVNAILRALIQTMPEQPKKAA